MLKPAVIDLSHWNTIIGDSYADALASLQLANDAGIIGVIHKATESISYTDEKVKARCDLVRDAQMLFGTYHFLRPGNMGQQVAFYYDTVMSIQKVFGEAGKWIWACDYEDPSIPLSDVADFCEELEAVISMKPVLYTGFALKDKILAGQSVDRLIKYPLWLAHYAPEPALPKGWSKYWLWQYSDSASVPGIVAPTDVNAYDGKVEDLIFEWTGQGDAQTKPPEPAVDTDDMVRIDINVPLDSKVQVSVNGNVLFKQTEAQS